MKDMRYKGITYPEASSSAPSNIFASNPVRSQGDAAGCPETIAQGLKIAGRRGWDWHVSKEKIEANLLRTPPRAAHHRCLSASNSLAALPENEKLAKYIASGGNVVRFEFLAAGNRRDLATSGDSMTIPNPLS